MTTHQSSIIAHLRAPAWGLTLSLLVSCGQGPSPSQTNSPGSPEPSKTVTPGKIERFEQWRTKPTSPSLITCHGFLTATWFHPDGLVHYFVSELLSYDIPKADAGRFRDCAATEKYAETFRIRVRELVARWPQGPKVDKTFGERHFSLNSDEAETQLLVFLDHRRRDTIKIHRLWLQ
jgi:hypothetical protein